MAPLNIKLLEDCKLGELVRANFGPKAERADARGRDGGVRQELAARVKRGTGRLFLDATGAIALIVFN